MACVFMFALRKLVHHNFNVVPWSLFYSLLLFATTASIDQLLQCLLLLLVFVAERVLTIVGLFFTPLHFQNNIYTFWKLTRFLRVDQSVSSGFISNCIRVFASFMPIFCVSKHMQYSGSCGFSSIHKWIDSR